MSESRSFSKTQDRIGGDTSGRGRSPHQDNHLHKHHSVLTEQKFKDLDAWIDVINTRVNASVIVDALIK